MRIVKWLMVTVVSITASAIILSVGAKGLEQQIQDKKDEMNTLSQDASDIGETINGLEDEKNTLEAEGERLGKELDSILSELQSLNDDITKKDNEIQVAESELELAEEAEQTQYKLMKLHIKAMYEREDINYFEILLSSKSVSELLNKVNYITSIAEYDNKMLEDYRMAKNAVESAKTQLEKELKDLQTMQVTVSEKQQEVADLVQKNQDSISAYDVKIAKAEELAAEYEKKISERQNELAALEEKQAEERRKAEEARKAEEKRKAEEQKRKEEEQKKNDVQQNIPLDNAGTDNLPINPGSSGGADTQPTGNSTEATVQPTDTPAVTEPPATTTNSIPDIVYQSSDLALLAAIVECEAGSETDEGKIAVANVVLNRVASSRYPNTIAEVLYQKYQFTPVSSGRFVLVLSRGAKSSCVAAAQAAMSGTQVVSGDILHFRTVIDGLSGCVIGNHVFY